MPRVKPSAIEEQREEKYRLFVGLIEKYKVVRGISDAQIAISARMAVRTLYDKKHHPQNFTYDQIIAISAMLKFDDDEKKLLIQKGDDAMNRDAITIKDCLVMYYLFNQQVILEAGHVVKFVKETKEK